MSSLRKRISSLNIEGRLGSVVSRRRLAVTVSTRGIGFATQLMLNNARRYNARRYGIELPDVHSLYRAFLGMIECKLLMVQPHFVDQYQEIRSDTLPMEFIDRAKYVWTVPEPICSILDTVGEVSIDGISYHGYLPVDSKDEEGRFVPIPEFVVLSNLREVVTALSDPNTPESYRKIFRSKNPIPCTLWSPDDVLMNPDDIIPVDYSIHSFRQDLACISLLDQLGWKIPQYQSCPCNIYEARGSRSMLVSNESMNLCQPQLNGPKYEGENLNNVLDQIPEGDIDLFWSSHDFDVADWTVGIICLVGELSSHQANGYSISANRLKAQCPYRMSYPYLSCVSLCRF